MIVIIVNYAQNNTSNTKIIMYELGNLYSYFVE